MKRQYCYNLTNTCNEFFENNKDDIDFPTSNSIGSEGSCSHIHHTPGTIVDQNIRRMREELQQLNEYFSYLSNSHELWDQADRFVREKNLADYFIILDRENGPLTLHSTMHEVFWYVKAGLTKLSDEMST